MYRWRWCGLGEWRTGRVVEVVGAGALGGCACATAAGIPMGIPQVHDIVALTYKTTAVPSPGAHCVGMRGGRRGSAALLVT